MFYFELFLIFLYFKITRVHRKEEKHTLVYKTFDLIVALVALYTFTIGFLFYGIITTLLSGFLFFIVAALMVTAVQVGIFFDGKPLIGIAKVYRLLSVIPVVSSFLILFL